jgi:hypothetical protein
MFKSLFAAIVFCIVPLNQALSGDPVNEAGHSLFSLSEAAARRQSTILYKLVDSTLRVTHDSYYVEDEGLPVPAAVLKEVFADIKTTQGITLRWLAVEGQAMNTDHKAQDDFERKAVKALKSGSKVYDQYAAGIYRRAAAITLENHCLKCHVPDRKSTRDRTAGLLIAIPVDQ